MGPITPTEDPVPLEKVSGADSDHSLNEIKSTTGGLPNESSTLLIYKPAESRRMLKNVIIISISFTLLFSGYSTQSNLQSSLNNDIPNQEGLGTYSQATVYASMVFSSMFIAPYIIQLLHVKWAITISMLGYGLYIAGQFYPTFYTLMPAGVVVGLCAAPLWAAKSTYLTHLGHEYARLKQDVSDVIIVRFFGIFFFLFQTHAIWGNLLSSLVLKSNGANSTAKDINTCGPNFCPRAADEAEEADNTDSNNSKEEEDKRNIYILASACLCLAISAAVVVGLFVDSMQRYGENERKIAVGGKLSGKALALATFKQMIHPYQLLIIPITIWSGLEQGFLSSDITRAYITCSWGIDKIGWTLMCYGIIDAIGSLTFGPIVRKVGRIPVFLFGALNNFGLLVGLLYWKPTPDLPIIYFIITGLWGFSDSIWQTQINAVYGVLFANKEEAAFCNYRLWESVGFIISFVISDLVCVKPKIYMLFTFLSVGIIGYLIVEIQIRKNRKKEERENEKVGHKF